MYEITTEGDLQFAEYDKQVLVEGGKMFWRRAFKNACSPQCTEVRWLVAELDGERIYCDGNKILMTKRDVYP